MKIKYLLIAAFFLICAMGGLFFEHAVKFYKHNFLTPKTLAQKLVDNPDSPFINYQQGLQNYKLRQFQKASKFFNKAAACARSNTKLRGVALANSANAKYHVAKQLIQPDKKFKKIKSENPKADAIELLEGAIKSYGSALESWPEEKVEKNKMIAESLLEQLKRSNDKDDDNSNNQQNQDQSQDQNDNQNQSNNDKSNQKNNTSNKPQNKQEPNSSQDSEKEQDPSEQQPQDSVDEESENQPQKNDNNDNEENSSSQEENSSQQDKHSDSSDEQNGDSAQEKQQQTERNEKQDSKEENKKDSEFGGVEEETDGAEEQEGQLAGDDEKSEEEAAEEKYAQMLKALSRQNFNDKLDKMESESEKVVKALIKAKTQGNLKSSKPNYGW